jgi:hypothetical protein
MSLVAFVTLDHLGLSPPPQDKPPPMREVLRVAEHSEGWVYRPTGSEIEPPGASFAHKLVAPGQVTANSTNDSSE